MRQRESNWATYAVFFLLQKLTLRQATDEENSLLAKFSNMGNATLSAYQF